jgi:replicative DNA helicase
MTVTLAQREPPHNFEAEQALLGAILVNNDAWSAASEEVKPEHFADPLHGKLFESLGRLIERGQIVSAFTLRTYAESDEGLKAAGGASYLAKLLGASVHALDVPSMARLVRDCATRRRLIGVLSDALPQAYDEAQEATPAEQIEALEHRLYEAAEGTASQGFQPFRAALTQAVKSAEAAHSRPDGMTGLPTGFHDLDDVLAGLHRSDLVVLAGRPGMGKSALGTNIGVHVAKQGVTVGFWSLEMSSEQLGNRIVAEQAGIDSKFMREGKLTNQQMDQLFEITQELESLPLYIDDAAAMSIARIRTRARRLKRQHGLGLVIVDYLQLVDAVRRRQDNRVQEVSEITRGLKALAKELDVPVLALSQLSRAVEQRQDKHPQLSDLRDSGTIEQDADVVMFIYREEYYRKLQGQDCSDVQGQAELSIAKHRHGPTSVVRLMFDGPTTRFSSVDRSDR